MPMYCKFRSQKNQIYRILCNDPTMRFDLKLLEADTMKEYGPEDLIPQNSSVTLMRVPLLETKNHRERAIPTPISAPSEISSKQPSNLVEIQCSEEEKVDLMMAQSTYAYAPSNYLKVPYSNSGKVPSTYVCKRCHKKGHWYQDCTMAKVVEGPEVPGATVTATGEYIIYAPELVPVVEERGTPKMPLPVRELKLLRKSDEIKEEAKDLSLSPPSGGEDINAEAVKSSNSNEPLDSMAWNGYSDDSYNQSSDLKYLRQDGGSYRQSGYDQGEWGYSYQYQGCEDQQSGYDQATGYETQPEANSGSSRHHSSRRSEGRVEDSADWYRESRHRENRSTKRRRRY
ncbi:hypothetical protein KQX54_019886 [Cotesia glomerata]|uniref:Zinc knuckle CX2CX3GHX4C domain-containing protein n=1 Tax=Cotesia glomerata TaxID=32391 RepID=A0AAV7HGH5_COTGL|nr:hypothetical protein KQX54_019886 [Cotesia glomerata]